MNKGKWIPETPAGTPLPHLGRDTQTAAWKALMKEAAHMPYKTQQDFERRGYQVLHWPEAS